MALGVLSVLGVCLTNPLTALWLWWHVQHYFGASGPHAHLTPLLEPEDSVSRASFTGKKLGRKTFKYSFYVSIESI